MRLLRQVRFGAAFNPQGDVLYDVLDAKGQVVLSGLTEVQNCSGDLFAVRPGSVYVLLALII